MSVTLDWVDFFDTDHPQAQCIVLDIDLNLIPPMSLKYGTNKNIKNI